MWVARDRDKDLYLYKDKPKRKEIVFTSKYDCHRLPNTLFPKLKWEDEPIKIELVEVE